MFNLPTLLAITVFTSGVAGCLLLLSWLQTEGFSRLPCGDRLSSLALSPRCQSSSHATPCRIFGRSSLEMRFSPRLTDYLKYPAIAQSWRRNWDLVIPFFAFPEGVRKIIYTTNAIEALNSKLRRAIRTRGHFPSDDAAAKLLYLVLNHAAADWKRPPREWFEAKTQFAVMFKERFVLA